ncbi:MAG: 4Fe-4S dicluster domain-containing protein [Dehalococcoidia bacterium]|nr:4Fe-4S dicluster domain-containing protein [Dehalococcoidia bacterium]
MAIETQPRTKVFRAVRELCDGCRMCEMVCSLNKAGVINPHLARIRIGFSEKSPFPTPIICRHCNNPPCQSVCPIEGAMTLDERTGAVAINEQMCIGCLACVDACPFGAIQVGPNKQVLKCDLCGGDPICVKYCPPRPEESLPKDTGTGRACLQYLEPHQVTAGKRQSQADKE